MSARAAPESAAVAPAAAAAVSWPVSSSENMQPADVRVKYRPSVKQCSHSTVPLPPRHTSVLTQLQSINSDVKGIFQWRRQATHEPTL